MLCTRLLAALCLVAVLNSILLAEDPPAAATPEASAQEQTLEQEKENPPESETELKIEVTVEELLTGLDNPTGVAVHPDSGHVYVAESAAGRVVRVDPATPGKAEDAITDFPLSTYGKGPVYSIGPLGLAFLDEKTLVVGGGGLEDGKELLQIYAVPPAGQAIKAETAKHHLGPIPPGEMTESGEGNFYGVAIVDGDIFVTCNGDDAKGWVARARLGEKPEFKPFIATKELTKVDAPTAISINRRGHVVVGQMGEISVPGDSLLTFYNAHTGKLLLNLPTGLHDITGLAYSSAPDPDLQRLYAVDFAWSDTSAGGLFRIDGVLNDDGSIGCTPILVQKLDKPTALAFAPDGKTLYVTLFGTAAEGDQQKPGKLLKITGVGSEL